MSQPPGYGPPQQPGQGYGQPPTAPPGYGPPGYPPPGYPPYGYTPQGGGPPPPNHLVWAILSTLFCCLPAGVASIVYATRVDGKYASGDYQGAVQASKNARMWAMIAAGLGIVLIVGWLLLTVVGVTKTSSNNVFENVSNSLNQ